MPTLLSRQQLADPSTRLSDVLSVNVVVGLVLPGQVVPGHGCEVRGVYVTPATEWQTDDGPTGQGLAERVAALEARVEALESRTA